MKAICKFERLENKGMIIHFPFKNEYGFLNVLRKCENEYGNNCMIEIKPPYKSRTTGQGSQNSLVWQLITIIANEIGEDLHDVELSAKEKAMARGYPYRVSKINGRPIPYSMTEINTVECSYLIDTLYEIIAFLGIELPPEYQK